jgi:hypothetical protein
VSPILGIWASANQPPYIPFASYESIATTTVGAGGAASVTFSSIPSTYTHLQIRAIARVNSTDWVQIRFNSDSGSNYSYHYLFGQGSGSGGSSGGASSTSTVTSILAPSTASVFGAGVIDILDYADTNKFKTVRSLTGFDENGAGQINLTSAAWRSTSAITSIVISVNTLQQYSSFALYGIK